MVIHSRRAAAGLLAALAAGALVATASVSASALPPEPVPAGGPASVAGPAAGPPPAAPSAGGRPGDAALAEVVRRAVAGAGFADVVDFGLTEGRCPGNPGCSSPARRIRHVPNVDTAVLQLDGDGRVVAAAQVLLSRDYPQAMSVGVDADLRPMGVHWYRWDVNRADGPTAWDAPRIPADDLLTGSDPAAAQVPAGGAAAYPFMSPYPASVFQLLVAAGTLHLVDQGKLALDAPYHYLQAPGSTCLGATFTDTSSTRALLDRMLTGSENRATCMLLKQLTDLGRLDAVNAWLSGLGLGTLQLSGIDAGSGGRWDPGRITMTALDTARLLLLVNGSPGALWQVPEPQTAGMRAVTADDALSASSRHLLRGLLADQGFNEVLSTTNWCGRSYPAAGIPQRIAPRWVDGRTGTVTVDGIPYGQDVRPCNAAAQVTFAHKTGLTYNFGGDAGIVDSLPSARDRHYVIVVLSDLGYRYADTRYATSPSLPCTVDVCYPQAFARLGRAVDDALGTAPAAGAPARPAQSPSGPAATGTPGTAAAQPDWPAFVRRPRGIALAF